jgi:hypothetical protein
MLDKRVIDIPFTQGVDKKSNPRLAPPGKLGVLQDGVFAAGHTLAVRPGYFEVTTTERRSSDAIGAGLRLVTRGAELLVESSAGLHRVVPEVYDDALSAGVTQVARQFVRTSARVAHLARIDQHVTAVDAAASGHYAEALCVAWLETNTLVIAMVDAATGQIVEARRRPGGGYLDCVRVVWNTSEDAFFVYGVTGSDLVAHRVDPSRPDLWGNRTTVASGFVSGRFDAVYDNVSGNTYLAYARAGTLVLRTLSLTAGALVLDQREDTFYPDRDIAICTFSNGNVLVAGSETTTLRGYVMPPNLSASTLVALSASTGTGRVGAIRNGASVDVTWDDGSGATLDTRRRILVATVNAGGTVGSVQEVVRSVALASKPFAMGGKRYVGAIYYTALESTFFVVELKPLANFATYPSVGRPSVVARILRGLAQPTGVTPGVVGPLPAVASDGVFTAHMPVIARGALELVAGNDVTRRGLALVGLDYTSKASQSVEYGGGVYFAGASPYYYDGNVVTEAGFHTAPDDGRLTATASAGGSLSAGTYHVRLVWERVDALGRRWQSQPSLAKSFTAALGDKVTVVCPTDRLTAGAHGAHERLVVYRTKANGTIFYRDSPSSGSIFNDPTVDTVTHEYTTSDANLGKGELLYVTGGVLEAEPLPAHRLQTIHQNRLVMAGLEDPYEVRYTNELLADVGAVASEVFSLRVPPTCGVITGLASMDDKLIISCARGTWFVYGEGPNRLGQMNGYSTAQLALADEGCRVDAPWTALSPEGLWFCSSRGIRLLTRGLSLGLSEDGVPMGGEVDALATTGLVAAHVGVPKALSQLVYFWTGTGALVWDVIRRQWSHFTNHNAVDARVWGLDVVHLRTNGTLYRSGGTTDAGNAIIMIADTNWLSFAGVQGFQRVWRLVLLGTFPAGTVIQARYDGGNFVTVATVAGSTQTQLRHHLAKQKCQAMSVRVFGATALTGLALEVGVKRGAAKLPAAQTV